MICMIGVPAKHKTRDLLQVCNSSYYSQNNFTEKIYRNAYIIVHCTMPFGIGNDEIYPIPRCSQPIYGFITISLPSCG